jgi:hypothetical protein
MTRLSKSKQIFKLEFFNCFNYMGGSVNTQVLKYLNFMIYVSPLSLLGANEITGATHAIERSAYWIALVVN